MTAFKTPAWGERRGGGRGGGTKGERGYEDEGEGTLGVGNSGEGERVWAMKKRVRGCV